MNKIFYLLSIISLFTITSCSDYLDQQSPDQLTSGNFWRNKADAESALAATYSQLEAAVDEWAFAEVKWPVEAYREDICDLGSDALNYQSWVELSTFTYTNGNPQFTTYWRLNYRGISNANQVIDKLPQVPAANLNDADRAQIEAEARFLRAYYHMKLLLNWDQIYVRKKYITKESDLSIPLSTRAEAWDFITSELKAAAAVLPAKQSTDKTGRATSGAANSYLGFAYLTRAYEETAQKQAFLNESLTALNKVQGYDLVKDYVSMFDGTAKNTRESIFELQFSETTANGAFYRNALHYWMAAAELGGWDEILPSKVLINEFKKEGKTATTGNYDTRFYSTIFFKDPYFNDPNNPLVLGTTYDDKFGDTDKPVFRKFIPSTQEKMNQEFTAINVPLMRYSNVLLMQAEVLNELGRTPEAIPYINKVRNRADMPAMTGTTASAVKAQIEHERILEFPLENYRFYDLRRWGKTKAALDAAGRTGFDAAKNNFYPIPLTELQAN
ncbi:RagB/SusD family nutrient uptake outer membrane protein [Flavobacterium plurextorum]|uniref:RagB/SusD family nutrient uptake outer membrane protein n=1 Tax=Flavobacterium plurextorum TaxID=1114867 RepID=A0ABX4CV65_9FLAO|nr:RagB/SusD family nutrient uptake outer membrane protein [Flavobacterium plurextorum]OXB07229.1 RagB/SusD family nutrient uptake outer membrane protein [Flavobacterium plurextorum]